MMREWYPAMTRAGLQGRFRLHDLRHFAVSRLIEQGADPALVSKVIGHANPAITLSVYGQVFAATYAHALHDYDPVNLRQSR
jgi:integrase